jgi:hypothetical protein
MNYIQIKKDLNNQLVNFSDKQISDYNKVIEKDSKFLLSRGLMDYSLLFVIEHIPFEFMNGSTKDTSNEENSRES